MNSKFEIKSALLAGFAGTAAMTVFTLMAPLMGFEMNIPRMLAGTMGLPILFGWLAHFMIGEILALTYAAVFLKTINADSGIKSGALFGLIPWLAAQIMVMPMMSIINGGGYFSGFFSGSILIASASLMGHLIYGTIVGAIYERVPINTNATV
jgi:uncharacterized membrane protein YagU involved in acid resistance